MLVDDHIEQFLNKPCFNHPGFSCFIHDDVIETISLAILDSVRDSVMNVRSSCFFLLALESTEVQTAHVETRSVQICAFCFELGIGPVQMLE